MDISKITVEKEKIDLNEEEECAYDSFIYKITIKFFIDGDFEVYKLQLESPSIDGDTDNSIIPKSLDKEWNINISVNNEDYTYKIIKYSPNPEADNPQYFVLFESIIKGDDNIFSTFTVKYSNHIDDMLLELENIYQMAMEPYWQFNKDCYSDSDDGNSDDGNSNNDN